MKLVVAIIRPEKLEAVQADAASMWNGRIGLPVALASHTAPGCATRAGPRGPSTVMPIGCPSSIARFARSAARAALREVDPRAVV